MKNILPPHSHCAALFCLTHHHTVTQQMHKVFYHFQEFLQH